MKKSLVLGMLVTCSLLTFTGCSASDYQTSTEYKQSDEVTIGTVTPNNNFKLLGVDYSIGVSIFDDFIENGWYIWEGSILSETLDAGYNTAIFIEKDDYVAEITLSNTTDSELDSKLCTVTGLSFAAVSGFTKENSSVINGYISVGDDIGKVDDVLEVNDLYEFGSLPDSDYYIYENNGLSFEFGTDLNNTVINRITITMKGV